MVLFKKGTRYINKKDIVGTTIVFFILLFFICIGMSQGNSRYGYIGNGVKFIEIQTPIGPTYINVSSIVSINKTTVPGRDGMTEISVINGDSYYTKDSVDYILERIIEL